MDTPARLRLYQYTYSPFCIPIELLLRHSGLTFDVVNLNVGDPTPVIQLTKGECYQVPVLQDLFSHEVIFDKSPDGMDVPRYIDNLAPLLRLFPTEVEGIHRVLLHYIENECESWGFKACDANWDRWIKNDVERGLLRRHKERKFGVGCLDAWKRDLKSIVAGFHNCIQPFEMILNKTPFLTGERPVFADYALVGVIGNFLFPGNTSLPENCLMLESWYTKMRAGNFRTDLDATQLASADQFDAQAGNYGKSHILADVADVEKAIAELKLRANTDALDVATGNGHTAIYLAKQGFRVMASDVSTGMLNQAMKLAADQGVNIDFREHPAEKLPYPDNSFGLVTCRVAAHHFSDPQAFVRETSRVLRTYGYLAIIDTTVPDDHVEAAQWMDTLERLRDPSHVKFVTPNSWRKWCADCGLTVTKVEVQPLKQPDLNWYFNVANTTPENRKKVLEMIAKAPAAVRELFKLGQEDGKIVWYWRRLTFVAGKI
jgi:ubiquinone/menaquinone biosynthesis C-methylase UbiE/glutathione S-transferase